MGFRADNRRQHASRPAWIRFGLAAIALVPLGLLAVAGNLDPDPSGAGTHRQLGLPPCSLRMTLGVRCPACGMTTSWSHFARGQFVASFQSNAGGCLLACLAFQLAVTAFQLIMNRPIGARQARWLGGSAVVTGVVTLADWAFTVSI